MILNSQLFDDDKMKRVAYHVLKYNPECCLISVDGLENGNGQLLHSDTGRKGDTIGIHNISGVEDCVFLITSRQWRFHALSTKTQKIFRCLKIDGIQDWIEIAKCVLERLGDPDPKRSRSEFVCQVVNNNMSRDMTKPTKWHVRPAKTLAVRIKKAWGLSYPLSGQRRL